MADGVIPEQLAEQAIPDWLGDEFRLIRERSEQNRMHMPGGDYHRLYWWSRHHGGETGQRILSPTRKSGCSIVLGSGDQVKHGQQEARGGSGGPGRAGGSTAKIQKGGDKKG